MKCVNEKNTSCTQWHVTLWKKDPVHLEIIIKSYFCMGRMEIFTGFSKIRIKMQRCYIIDCSLDKISSVHTDQKLKVISWVIFQKLKNCNYSDKCRGVLLKSILFQVFLWVLLFMLFYPKIPLFHLLKCNSNFPNVTQNCLSETSSPSTRLFNSRNRDIQVWNSKCKTYLRSVFIFS